jgi:hypothetical protein
MPMDPHDTEELMKLSLILGIHIVIAKLIA